jgi:hypothetical protein
MSRFAPPFMDQTTQEYAGAGHVAVPAPFAGNREETDELLMLLAPMSVFQVPRTGATRAACLSGMPLR